MYGTAVIRIIFSLFLAAAFSLGAEELSLSGAPWKLTLGKEFPGASGKLTTIGHGKATTWILESDFSKGGNYTGIILNLDPALDIECLSFRIVSPAREVAVQVRDSENQVFVRFLKISGSPDVTETVEIEQFQIPGDRASAHWGGPGDGIVRPPFKTLTIRTLAARLPNERKSSAIVRISDIKASIGRHSTRQSPTASSAISRKIEAPGAFPETPARLITDVGSKPIRFTLRSTAPRKQEFSYQLRDYSGHVRQKGTLRLLPGRKIEMPVPKKNGFYEYVVPELNLTAGLLVIPRYTGERDQFFGIDSAMSVFRVYKNDTAADALLSILEWGGLSQIRDRFNWKDIEKTAPGEFHFNAFQSERLRNQARQHGLKVLDVFHDAPRWTGADANRTSNTLNPFPRDLLRTAVSWRQFSLRFGQYWCGLEVWNEPEIAFGASLPGDQLAALQRTISYEFARNGITVPLIGGVFTGSSGDEKKLHLYLRNGLLEDSDIFSFHSYADAEELQNVILRFRTALGKSPGRAIPFWITECGKPWPNRGWRAELHDDQNSALHIAMKAVEAKANGVAAFFPFVYTSYKENINNFGMLDQNLTPMRSLAGYFNVVRILSNFRYVGDLKITTGAKLNRVFIRGNEAKIVIYTGNPETPVNLPPSLKLYRIEGLDGRELPLQNQYNTHDGILYASARTTDLADQLNHNTAAMELLAIAEEYRPRKRLSKPVVPQFSFDHAETGWTLYGYLFNHPENAKIPLIFNNLSNKSLTITPVVELPSGARLLCSLPKTLVLPPQKRICKEIRVDLTGAFKLDKQPEIIIRDQSGNMSQLVIGTRKWHSETLVIRAGISIDKPLSFKKLSKDWHILDEDDWKRWQGGNMPNIKAAFKLSYDSATLLLQVFVEDHSFYQPYAVRDAWRADSVQAGIQILDNNGRRKQPFTEIIAARTPTGDRLYRSSCESGDKKNVGELSLSTLEFTRTPSGMLYSIRLNASELGAGHWRSGMRIGFALLINSSEKGKRDGYLHWGDGIGENKNAREFNILELR